MSKEETRGEDEAQKPMQMASSASGQKESLSGVSRSAKLEQLEVSQPQGAACKDSSQKVAYAG